MVVLVMIAIALVPWTVRVTSAENVAKTKPAIKSRAYLHSYNLPSSGVALEGYCPVAYFAVNKPVRGNPEFASRFNGVSYHFVSADAKKLFDKHPEKYLPAYGGWCAFGMNVQDKFPVDPTKFKIVDGRLLLFLANKHVDALELWNSGDQQQQLANADAHWQTVSK
jgi:YHS domain-containing protein